MTPKLTLGLLGGMGPAATLDFLTKLQAFTPAETDQDHIRVIA
ncbi:MAG: aspartate racemase, partial [Phenylobacterium sp.]|nr:aspartate racemase [Phenylobacterium sp.]